MAELRCPRGLLALAAALWCLAGAARAEVVPVGTAGDRWAVLSWAATTEESSLGVTRYYVYRNTIPVGETGPGAAGYASTDTRAFWDRGLANGTTYGYRLFVAGSGTAYDTATVWVTPSAASPVFGTLYASSGDGFVRLAWNVALAIPAETGVTVFRIYRAAGAAGLGAAPADEVPPVGTYLDEGLVDRVEYAYLLEPCCPVRSPSLALATPFRFAYGYGTPLVAPDPTGRALSFVVSWGPALNDAACGGGGDPAAYPVASYNVYRSDDGGTTMKLAGNVPAAGCALRLVTRVPAYGRRYYFLVRPVDDRGIVGDAYPIALIDVPLPENRVLLDHNLFRPGPEHGQALAVDFQVIQQGHVLLSIWTATGEAVRRKAFEGDVADPGIAEDAPYNTRDRQLHPFTWDGTNDAGDVVFSGVYLVVLEAAGHRDIRTVAVLR